MDFIPQLLQQYCEDHSDPEPEILKEVNRTTHLRILRSRMLSGHFQGRLLSFFSKLIQPENILEIGTYTGYSAICLAEGLKDGGKLITIDCNEELEDTIKQNIQLANMTDKIEFVLGDALTVLNTLSGPFDIVFLDADKENYLTYYGMVFEKIRVGGIILADNVLWSGKVLEETKQGDADTQAIKTFNDHLTNDSKIEKILLPVRDGIFMARKIKH